MAKATKKTGRDGEAKTEVRFGAVCLVYDIPSGSDYPNPSGALYPHGFRLNYSCWVIHTSRLTAIQPLLDGMTAAGIDWEIIRYDHREKDKVLARARKELGEFVPTLHAKLIENLAAAKTRFDAALAAAEEAEGGLTERQGYDLKLRKLRDTKAHLSKCADKLNAACEAANLFDATESIEDLVEATRLAIASEQASYDSEVAAFTATYPQAPLNGGGNGHRGGRVGPRQGLFGTSPTAVLRWMGSKGFDYEKAKKALEAVGAADAVNDMSIRWHLRAGQKGIRTLPTLTPEQEAQLTEAAGA